MLLACSRTMPHTSPKSGSGVDLNRIMPLITYTDMRPNPAQREEFRDMLATADVRRLIANAIRSERHVPSLTSREVRVLETIRDELKSSNAAFSRQAVVV